MFQSKCTKTQFLLNDMFLCLRLKLLIIQPPPPPVLMKVCQLGYFVALYYDSYGPSISHYRELIFRFKPLY